MLKKLLIPIVAILFFVFSNLMLFGQDTIESLEKRCSVSIHNLEFSIEDCNCSNINFTGDTVYVDLFPPIGGDVLGKFLKINLPTISKADYIVKLHQNRMYVSSMGPDPVFDNWKLYNSPKDTIRFDEQKLGFFIDSVLHQDSIGFPEFERFDFYRAFKNYSYSSHVASKKISDLRLRFYYVFEKAMLDSVLERSDVELYRVILELRNIDSRVLVFIFTYGHEG